MITSHHIAAQLARERECDLLEAAAASRAAISRADDASEASASGAAERTDGRLLLRSWRARRAAAAEPGSARR